MVLKSDHERVKALLKDTITLLCKNGLTFKSKFSLEALIGVTLDDGDVFLLSINEIIKSDNYQPPRDPIDTENNDQTSDLSSAESSQRVSAKKRRKKHKVKTEIVDNSDVEETTSMMQDFSPHHTESSVKKARVDPPPVQDDEENSDDDRKDIVIIKDEIDTWSESFDQGEVTFPDMGSSQGASSSTFPLSDATLVPLSGQDSSNVWLQPGQQRGQHYSTATASASSFGQTHELPPGTDTRLIGTAHPSPGLDCNICGKKFQLRNSLKLHLDQHQGKFPYRCEMCDQGFTSTTHLKGHMASHTGLNEFPCSLCNKEFRYSAHLRRHERNIHKLQRPRKQLH